MGNVKKFLTTNQWNVWNVIFSKNTFKRQTGSNKIKWNMFEELRFSFAFVYHNEAWSYHTCDVPRFGKYHLIFHERTNNPPNDTAFHIYLLVLISFSTFLKRKKRNLVKAWWLYTYINLSWKMFISYLCSCNIIACCFDVFKHTFLCCWSG